MKRWLELVYRKFNITKAIKAFSNDQIERESEKRRKLSTNIVKAVIIEQHVAYVQSRIATPLCDISEGESPVSGKNSYIAQ